MTGFNFMNGDPTQMRGIADNWRGLYEEVANRNTSLNTGNTGLEGVWKGAGGRMFQGIEPDRFAQNQRLTTSGHGLADTLTTSANKYFENDAENGRALGVTGDFQINTGSFGSAFGAV
ncbi:WXG100 family type VII secretion target [Amycolatopsis halotolerans]|uniref:WXG100 family type VII secretion target n=1 Tax=Amycolatopsis halotolerans TaxID=330083 RepID=A0ABV7QBE3_9PSEU